MQNRTTKSRQPRVTTSSLSEIGPELRRLRFDANIRIFDLAKSLGVSSASVSAWETGRRSIPDEKIDEIQEYFGLSARELESLKKAAQSDRDKVVIEPKSRQARKLANLLKEGINNLSSEKIAELTETLEESIRNLPTNTDFECSVKNRYLKIDHEVPKLTGLKIREKASALRAELNVAPRKHFDVVDFYERKLPILFCEKFGKKMANIIQFEILEDNEIGPGVWGRASLYPPRIQISNGTYEGAVMEDCFSKWVMAHELGHIWLLHGLNFRNRISSLLAPTTPVPSYSRYFKLGDLSNEISAEWQADEFAFELLMPANECSSMNLLQMRSAYRVSEKRARMRETRTMSH